MMTFRMVFHKYMLYTWESWDWKDLRDQAAKSCSSPWYHLHPQSLPSHIQWVPPGSPTLKSVFAATPEDPSLVLETAPPLRKTKVVGKVGGDAKKGNMLADHWPPLPQGAEAKGWVLLC